MAMESIKIVLASPSDLSEERKQINIIVNHLDRRFKRDNVTLDLRCWEDTIPGANLKGPQEIIDDDLDIGDADIFLCMFWKKTGTILPSLGKTGTEHELNLAIESFKTNGKPNIKLLTKTTDVTDKNEEFDKIESIKKEVRDIALYKDFSSMEELTEILNIILWEEFRKHNPSTSEMVNIKDKTCVETENVLLLLNEIKSNQSIILHNKFYDLLSATEVNSSNVEFVEVYDGREVIISNISNLTIMGDYTKIIVDPRYATVLTFRNCENISLYNLSIGHTPHKGDCVGAVLRFGECNNIALNNMELFGCGTYGLELNDTSNVCLRGSHIFGCSYGALSLYASDLTLENTTISDCQNTVGSLFELDSSYIYMKNVLICDNEIDNKVFFLSNSNIYGMAIDIINNKYYGLGAEIEGLNLYNNEQQE